MLKILNIDGENCVIINGLPRNAQDICKLNDVKTVQELMLTVKYLETKFEDPEKLLQTLTENLDKQKRKELGLPKRSAK